MSVIGRKPFVNYIIDACKKEYIVAMSSLMDNLGSPKLVSLYGTDNLISDSDKGASYVTLEIEPISLTIYSGILVYVDSDHCGFFGIASNSDVIEEYKIDPVTKNYWKIRENLTIEELRQVIEDKLIEKGEGDYVNEDEVSMIYEATNIQNLSKDLLNKLKPGDVVQKITGNEKHTYVVSYKGTGAGTGICLTYVDCGYMETVSYDRSGSNWVYNSKDVKEVASLSEVVPYLEDKDVKVKTIEQSEPNWSLDFASAVPSVLDDTNNQYIPIYCRFEVLNNILYIVWNFKIKNLREYDAPLNWLRIRFILPEDIADKIYDIDGHKVSESGHANPITSDMLFYGSTSYPASIGARNTTFNLTHTSTANELEISCYIGEDLKSGVDTSFTARTFLTLK